MRTGVVLLLGLGVLVVRLVWEQTVLSWERGPQMVGFSLIHGAGVILILFPILVLGWLAIATIHLGYHASARRTVSRVCLVEIGVAVVLLGLLWPSYGFWQRMFVDRLVKGPHAARFFVYAAAGGDLPTVEAFVAHGLSPDIRDRRGRTALLGAAVAGRAEIIRYLISVGADVNAIDRMGDSALQLAISGHHPDSVDLLSSHGAVAVHGDEEQRKKVVDELMTEDLKKMGLLPPGPPKPLDAPP